MNPESEVVPVVRPLLKEVGITLTERTPRLVTQEQLARAARVVTFGCLDRCPAGAKGKNEDWPLPGSTAKSMDELRGIRDELSRRVDDLIRSYCLPVRQSSDEHPSTIPMTTPKIEDLKRELIKAARAHGTLTYGELMKILGISRGRPLFEAIVAVDRDEYSRGAPGFAAIIVRKDTGFPGGGFFCDDELPPSLRRPFSGASNPKLSAAEMNYIKEAQKKIWAYYSNGPQTYSERPQATTSSRTPW